jgi:hypothetical protein
VKEAEKAQTESKAPSPKKEVPQSEEDRAKEEAAKIKLLEQRFEKTKAQVERLLEKMTALWQKYNNPGDMTPKEMVQSEIARTYLMLQKAQEEAAKAQDEWETAQLKQDK